MKAIRVIAAIIALIGIADAVYLTVHHYTAEAVPCTLTGGCEQVLTSEYAEIAGIPLAAYGAAAYFIAFSLVLLSIYGNRMAWTIFGVQVVLMAIFTGWLIYVQAALIGAFCQFCLLSAATTFTLTILFLISLGLRRVSQ
ncbi:MAG TPA: vitamin K epoxide reductase family protein [Pyrinomonadaceae bacterium]|jgi:uncharacterized membrane protein|nr:vitamin K epoxide reductase family protein [Pyrinomonadaceae bacterium]